MIAIPLLGNVKQEGCRFTMQPDMAFCLFTHTAVFPKEHWPRGYGVNGYVRLAGRKMSKSRGNTWYIREALKEWPADVIRLMVANGGDGLDDPNLDVDFAEAAGARLRDWFRFATAATATAGNFIGVTSRSGAALGLALYDANGQPIRVAGYELIVVGTVAPRGNVLGQSQDNFVLVPFGQYQKMFGPHESLLILMRARPGADMERAQDEARVILRSRRHVPIGKPDDFAITTSDTYMALYQKLTAGIFAGKKTGP